LLLAFVFAFTEAFEDGEASLFGVADGKRLRFDGGIKGGDEFADRAFAGGTGSQFRSAGRPPQGELAAADDTIAIAKFVLVKRHRSITGRPLIMIAARRDFNFTESSKISASSSNAEEGRETAPPHPSPLPKGERENAPSGSHVAIDSELLRSSDGGYVQG